MPTFPAFRTKPYYEALKTWLTTALNEDGTLRTSAVQPIVAAEVAAQPNVAAAAEVAAAAAVDAEPRINSLISDTTNLKAGNPAAYQDFRGAANGPLTTMPTGQPWQTIAFEGVTAGIPTIVDGGMTNTQVTGKTAGYAEVELDGDVKRIGATVRYHPGGGGGGGAIVIWQYENTPGNLPNSGMHFRITPSGMAVDIWTNAGVLTTLRGAGQSLVQDGVTEYTYEASIRGDTVTVWCSDGTSFTVSDPRVETYAGPWACWEVFAADSATEAKIDFVEVWADTATRSPRNRGIVEADAARIVTAMAPDISDVSRVLAYVSWDPATLTTVALTGTYQELGTALRPTFKMPANGKALVTLQVRVYNPASSNIVTRASWGPTFAIGDFAAATNLIWTSYNGLLTTMMPVSTAPGANVTLYFGFATTNAGGGSVGAGAGWRASVKVETRP